MEIHWKAWAHERFPVVTHFNGNTQTNVGHILKSYVENCGIDTDIILPGKAVSGRKMPKKINRMKRKVSASKYSIPFTQPVIY